MNRSKFTRTLILVLVGLLAITTLTGDVAWAKKKLPIGGKTQTTSSKKATGASGVSTKVKFQPGKKGIVATFSNLEIAKSVSYSLSYTYRGIQEGAGGSLTDLSGPQTRELLFATCSSGVCRYHSGIKNARFVVTTTLTNGKKVSKVFRLKV